MTTIIDLFWNTPQSRLRTPWRFLALVPIGVVTTIIISIPFFLFGTLMLGSLPAPSSDPEVLVASIMQSPLFVAFMGAWGLLVTLANVCLAGYLLDRRAFKEFGFHLSWNWLLDFGFGLGLGIVLMTGIFVVEWLAGWIVPTVAVNTDWQYLFSIGAQLILFLCVGIYEELGVRGYLLRNIAEGLNMPAWGARGAVVMAWILTSIVFGVLHSGNSHTTLISTFNLALAGIFLGLSYVLTGELAIPIGLHITWNLFQGTVFGFPVSGEGFRESLISIQQGGPTLWTGGPFGPEAGLIGVLMMVAGCALILMWVRLRYGKVTLRTALAEYTPQGGDRIPSPHPTEIPPAL